MKLRKFLFSEVNKVSKHISEYILNCVGEYEEQMMRLISKNERFQGCLEESNRMNAGTVNARSYAKVTAQAAGKRGNGVSGVSPKDSMDPAKISKEQNLW